ncbi:MAG: hypothetical protein GYB65_10710 [Chloroflexi bacterium]|nr:hypothetical protein [Chloroflexota bacterium]
MGVDYIIGYDCDPKNALTVEGLMGRLKGRERAQAVIRLYREEGDTRPPSKMGFEMVRRAADGSEEVEVIVVQKLLDAADELQPWEASCADCPANRARQSFGCIGSINYPISVQAEFWLLNQLPDNDHPLIFALLQRALREHGYTGQTAAGLRNQEGIFFETADLPDRDINGLRVTGDQVFEMLFLTAPIRPAHASLLLQFFGGIAPDLDADVMMQLAAPPSQAWIDEHVPFLHAPADNDDVSIIALKGFFEALHIGFQLSVPVLLDV